ncbi:bacterioferritin [Nitrospina watsonii]|uniref:Bacterioferritin n=1 Tax=Nitrospina watsonii TaxID=1323948 RepID=A0ABN8VVU9_9BACT|nr:bacterioferritin [Nitrospina watsonii]CAI2717905.1 Bacterioferritin [Nitrospina watsonii]
MKGDKKVIDALNELLTAELTAINIYYLHYKMQENWGYEKLAEHSKAESMSEMKHAAQLIDRILYLEGAPNMARYDEVPVGKNCEEQLQSEYKYEKKHVDNLKKHIRLCLDKNDFGTKEILDGILVESEEGCDWLETQFQRIQDVGIQNYLTEHMKTE